MLDAVRFIPRVTGSHPFLILAPAGCESFAASPGPTILVVEDDPLVRDTIVWELQDAGYVVIEATTGEAALARLREGRVDLLFTDIRLSTGLDGWSVAEEARSLYPGLPVIYATGYTVEQPRVVPGGVFLHKPYRPSAVIHAATSLGVAPAD